MKVAIFFYLMIILTNLHHKLYSNCGDSFLWGISSKKRILTFTAYNKTTRSCLVETKENSPGIHTGVDSTIQTVSPGRNDTVGRP